MEDKIFFLFKCILQKVNDISIYRVEISPKGHHDKCSINKYIIIYKGSCHLGNVDTW